MTKGQKPLTRSEIEFLISLVRGLKSELISSKEVGIKVPETEQDRVSQIEKRLEVQLACLSS